MIGLGGPAEARDFSLTSPKGRRAGRWAINAAGAPLARVFYSAEALLFVAEAERALAFREIARRPSPACGRARAPSGGAARRGL